MPEKKAAIHPGMKHRLWVLPALLEAIEVHHLVPCCDEVLHKLLPGIFAGIELGKRSKFRVRTEYQIGTRSCPLELAAVTIASFEHLPAVGAGRRFKL
jgi:hypothetical protein